MKLYTHTRNAKREDHYHNKSVHRQKLKLYIYAVSCFLLLNLITKVSMLYTHCDIKLRSFSL
jgi:hypothetical protein